MPLWFPLPDCRPEDAWCVTHDTYHDAPAAMQTTQLERDINQQIHAPTVYELTREQARQVVSALRLLPSGCRFHGRLFEKLGVEPWGEPRCDSCKAPWHRERALELLTGRRGDDAELEH